jgi:hypothetical protein
VLKLSFPQLHPYAKKDNGTVRSILQIGEFSRSLSIALIRDSIYDQFCELRMMLLVIYIFWGMVNIQEAKHTNILLDMIMCTQLLSGYENPVVR